METSQIVALLVSERDRLNSAIEALEGPRKRIGRPPKNAAPEGDRIDSETTTEPAPKKKRRKFSAAQRRAASERMRKRWAAKRKLAAKGTKKAVGKSRKTARAA
jgi:hypothetical protein